MVNFRNKNYYGYFLTWVQIPKVENYKWGQGRLSQAYDVCLSTSKMIREEKTSGWIENNFWNLQYEISTIHKSSNKKHIARIEINCAL